jgi:threonine/homoserine efflux transporter RhtA
MFSCVCSLAGHSSFVGTLFAGPASSMYGALTIGAMFGVAAMFTGGLALIVALLRFRDWRAWLSIAFCGLALLSTMAHSVRHSGP